MTHKHEVLDRFGNRVEEDRPALRDGERIKVGVLLMDSASPDLADDANAAREKAYSDRCDRMSDAWRNPSPVILDKHKQAPAPITPDPTTLADVEAALAQRDQRLQNAWRNA